MLLLAKDFTYRMHKLFFDLTIEEFNFVHYKMMGNLSCLFLCLTLLHISF
ncbi:DUF6868 family protein [Pseudemcibacter sp.]